jgi:prolyl-tRNA synthetase
MRPRLFLRTSEFLWQEGHTAHATEEEARKETEMMLEVYAEFAENYLAMPVIKGEKSEAERFPGAISTYCIEAMMQDRKALQAGTSHFLGQNFSKASQIKYLSIEGKEVYTWTTSWGVSTRLIGGVIMTHGDDDGLVLPPRISPAHIVIMPITHKEDTKASVLEYCDKVYRALREIQYQGQPLRVELDKREMQGGEKVWSWIKKGIPLWVEIGPRDVDSNSVFIGRRDIGKAHCKSQPFDKLLATINNQLDSIQNNLYVRAKNFREENTHKIDSKDDFYSFFTPKNKNKPEIHGGFALSHWCGDAEVEKKINEELNTTIRCIPFNPNGELGTCIFTGKPSKQRVIFAKSY